jgi:hypothetical protein
MRKKINIIFMILILMPASIKMVLSQEDQITITTYFPAPSAHYRWLRTVRMNVSNVGTAYPANDGEIVWGTGRGYLRSDQGASIELGGNAGLSPYINFSNNARIALTAGASNISFTIPTGGTYDSEPVAGRSALPLIDTDLPTLERWADLYVRCVRYHWGWPSPGVPPNGSVCKNSLTLL